MPKLIPINQETKQIDYLFPLKLPFLPLVFLAEKVASVFQFTIGYFARIGVFSFGEWNRSWIKKKIITLYKGGLCNGANRTRYDEKRHLEAFNILKKTGGIQSFSPSKDGTMLDSMLVRYRDVRQTIINHGGKVVSSFPIQVTEVRKEGKDTITYCKEKGWWGSTGEYVDVILRDGNAFASEEIWNSFTKETLSKLGLEKFKLIKENGEKVEGFIIKHWDHKNPNRPKENQLRIRCNSPTESYPMAKRDIIRSVLAGRSDVLAFDYRGTWRSGGIPSEGGYYIDGEAMVEKAVHDYGYSWKDIWAEGFCVGGAVAIHLYKKYHEKGINLIVQNTFNSMASTFNNQMFPANKLAVFGLPEIQSRDPLIRAHVQQDCFNSLGKLESLHREETEKKGNAFIVNTSTDGIVNSDSHSQLATGFYYVAENVRSIFFEPTDKTKDGHTIDVMNATGHPENRKVFDSSINFMAKVRPQRSRFWSIVGR